MASDDDAAVVAETLEPLVRTACPTLGRVSACTAPAWSALAADHAVGGAGFALEQDGVVQRPEHGLDAQPFEPGRAGGAADRPRTRWPPATRPAAIDPPM